MAGRVIPFPERFRPISYIMNGEKSERHAWRTMSLTAKTTTAKRRGPSLPLKGVRGKAA
jgi:hypothetical protein